jgi:hypothetical protein
VHKPPEAVGTTPRRDSSRHRGPCCLDETACRWL